MPSPSVQEPYDKIAEYYDLLSEGDDNSLFFRAHAEIFLKDIPRTGKVLDAACGTGDHALWLARQGYQVYASDISRGMIREAITKAEKEGAAIHFFHSSWESLPKNTNKKFDFVALPGNSVSHIASLEMLNASIKGIRAVTRHHGRLLFDIRNWEKTFEENSLHDQEFKVKRGKEILHVKYAYEIRGWNSLSAMYVEITPAKQSSKKVFAFDFFPLSFLQLAETLNKNGFSEVEKIDYPDNDHYLVAAK